MNSFESKFHNMLVKDLETAVSDVASRLINGGARRPTAQETASEYLYLVGYAQCLRDIQKLAGDIEDRMMGKEKGETA